MSLPIWAKGGLVLLTGSAISGTVVGFTKLSPSTYSGSGVAAKPRLVIARGNGSGAELSFNYDSFFGGGTQETKDPIPFNKVEMEFGGYRLKEEDLLCSPEQRGEYFVMQYTGKTIRGIPYYKIDGYPDEVTGCHTWILRNGKGKNIKLLSLSGFRPLGSTAGGATVSTIYVSNCSFSLNKEENGKIKNITASGCTTKKNRHIQGSGVVASPIFAEYEVS